MTLTGEELERLTADAFARLNLTDDEKFRLKEINRLREQERQARIGRIRLEETPLVAELQAIGLKIVTIDDLVNRREKYGSAIPILLRHLQMSYSDAVKEGIARSLAVTGPAVQKAWPILVDEYTKSPAGWGIKGPGNTKELRLGAKEGLAFALSVAVTQETLPELIALAKDRALGESRVLLLSALKRRREKNSLARQAINELSSDSELAKEISSW